MSRTDNMTMTGRVWIVGDNINTDLMLPIQAYYLSIEEQPAWVFSANRPGWSDQVAAGDILIAGGNFGVVEGMVVITNPGSLCEKCVFRCGPVVNLGFS